jgi:flagellin-like protein
MKLRQLLKDDGAVSPVIGVILMVAITVILAAVIAAFVLGLGDTEDPAPQVSFDYDYNDGNDALNVTVQSGDTFDAGNVDISGPNVDASLTDAGDYGDSSTIGAGDTFSIDGSGNSDSVGGSVASGDTVSITFTPDGGGESSTIGTFTAPE